MDNSTKIDLTMKDVRTAFFAGYDFAVVMISRGMSQIADWREAHPGEEVPDAMMEEFARALWAQLPKGV